MKRVIYTVIVGGYDRLREPEPYPGWDFVCFTDGRRTGWRSKVGLSHWDIRPIHGDAPTEVLRSRLPKILPHRYLQDYDYSVYIDGNAWLLEDPTGPLETMGWPKMAVSEHPFRETVFEEIDECVLQNKAPHDLLATQREAYRAEGLPENTPLLENNLLLRRHNDPDVIRLMEAWWDQMNTHSHRDQLSLPFVAWRQNFAVHTFPQAFKRTFFATRAHYRSPWRRWKRSLDKRLGKAG